MNIKRLFNNVKIRNLFIIFVIVIIIIGLLVVYFFKQTDGGIIGRAKLTKIPDSIQFESGSKNMSKAYMKTLMKSEKRKYQNAIKKGKSNIPTFIDTGDKSKSTGTLFKTSDQICSPSCYKLLSKQYASYKTPANLLSRWVKQGRLLPSTASELSSLEKQSKSEAEYAAALNQMVKDGKLTPAQARRLLEAYRHEHDLMGTAKSDTDDLIDQMVSQGDLSPQDAANLLNLVDHDVPVKNFDSELDQLVQGDRLTEASAKELSASYKRQKKVSSSSGYKTKMLAVGEGKRAEGGDSAFEKFKKMQKKREEKEREKALREQELKQQTIQRSKHAAVVQTTLKSLQGAISVQMKSLIKSWGPVVQRYVFSKKAGSNVSDDQKKLAEQGRSKFGKIAAHQIPMLKAGSILFAILNTGVNSDQQGPVMATIVNGKFKGAKLIGSLKQTSDGQRVVLTFNEMSMQSWDDVINIKAVAINPDTAHTAIASDVDNHYILRYGMLFASAFIQGLSQAVQLSGSTNVSDNGTNTTARPKLDTTEKLYVAGGKVGEKFSTIAEKQFNRRPTVVVKSGVGIGVLFTDSVYKYPKNLVVMQQNKEKDS